YAIILLSLKGKPTCQKNLTKIVNCVLALLGWSLIFYERAMDIAKNLGVISSDSLIFIYLLCVASVTFVNVALSELSDESQKKDDKL
ncbi:MAG: hypothetical protein IKI99_00880, partial [Firmicutes bacterium]|nr:hypothetical protein [Bacillota bacterium]